MPSPTPKPSDTSFRRTWDRTTYAAKAHDRDTLIKAEGAARAEAKSLGKKYIPRASTPPDAQSSTHRTSRFNAAANVGKITLVPAGSGVGKRGRSAGFYCEACDLTFKDNLQFVEHENSRQHQVNTGQSGEVRRAGLEEVRERLAWLVRRKKEEREAEEGDSGVRLRERLEGAVKGEEEEREAKRARRREKRRKGKGEGDGDGVKQEEEEGYGGGIIC
ncbi:MAG: U4/U6.U5 snRNP associated protein [Ramalina farinacea]|uniref:U4/U6.U5 snRNP associated protein n=1 Tax=Ramalina farinacea TaxID=258253 RepID=A0AA43QLK1_9LECA|nr:U4/U6.U5 snRNP associated protein [Ramalina farinacea]